MGTENNGDVEAGHLRDKHHHHCKSQPVVIPSPHSSLQRHLSDTILVRESPRRSFTQRRLSTNARLSGISGQPEVITITPNVLSDNSDDERCSVRSEINVENAHTLDLPLLTSLAGDSEGGDARLRFAFNASWAVNWLLLVAKIYAFAVTNSKAVLASLADSAVDLASQGVIAVADALMRRDHPRYPVGRTRLEAVGVIMCAVIMSLSSFEVVQFAAVDLYSGWVKGQLPSLELGLSMYLIMGVATGLKLLLYFYCVRLKGQSDAMGALAEDHLNDVLSNAAAVVTAAIAAEYERGWWVDPVGALVISSYIIWRWSMIVLEQVNKLVGQGAPEEFVRKLEEVASGHHNRLSVDVIRAYHFGARFMVEMEVVMPADMTVAESHDIALVLQHKVECFDEVERAFVHVDYQRRDAPEHKLERTLLATTPRSTSGRLVGSSSRNKLDEPNVGSGLLSERSLSLG